MPQTLHAAWLRHDEPFADGKLFFWAETLDFQPGSRLELPAAPAGGDLRNGVSGTRQRTHKTPSHPGQLPVSQLRTVLGEEVNRLPINDMQPATTSVWLPSRGGMPLARRGLLQTNQGARSIETGAVTLQNWQISGLALPPLPALVFLSQLRQPGRRWAFPPATRLERLRMGNDLLYWSNAAKFVLEVLIGQHYIPSVRMDDAGVLYALWQPALLDDRIKRRFGVLVESMPAVCRAYALEQVGDALSPHELSEHFVGSLSDAAVRTWSNGQPGTGVGAPALRWVQQLHASSRIFHLPPQPAHQLVQEWRTWIEQLHVTSDANFRITFELVEPDQSGQSAGYAGALAAAGEQLPEERTHWTLRYYLQARDDPRLLIAAVTVWGAPNGALRIGNRRVDRPQERLLAGLGAASRLFPPVERGLRSPRPELAILTAGEAHRFLREAALLLENNGFGVILPEWWDARQRTRLGLRLRLFGDQQALWNSNDDELTALPGVPSPHRGTVRYAWDLMLGAEQITQHEFERLAALDEPLLNRNGQWIELDPTQVSAAQKFLDERESAGEMSFLQSIRMAQGYLEQTGAQPPAVDRDRAPVLGVGEEASQTTTALPLEAVDVDGRLGEIIEHLRSQTSVAELAEPQGFVGELRPYQRRGVGWLVYLRRLGLGACLADDMGLGKTVQAIAMLLHERQTKSPAVLFMPNGAPTTKPTLLVCPTSVVANWRREVERFAPRLRVMVHHGGSRLEGAAFAQAIQEHDLVITSYGTARRDVDVLQQTVWADLILDEAQNIKNPSAKQSQAVRRLLAYNRVALTGTPVENHLTELWSVLEFLNPGYLGSQERFRQQFVVPIERYNDDQQAAELRRLVQPFLLRRLKSDPTIISDLPEKNEMVVYCSLTQEQAALYEATVKDALAALDRADGIQRRGLVLSLLTRLKQICNHPAHYLKQDNPLAARSGKLERLTEMLEEALSVGDHALVFTQFVEMGTLLQRHLREKLETEVIFLHGGTTAQQRDQMVQAFQDDDGPPIFVLSLRAGGSGLNLTRANHVFHFDRWWNPAVENQATDRAFRIGQQRNVQVHKFVVAGTLEERIHSIIESKQALAESIVGSGESWLTELQTEELRELLTLRQETIDE